MMLHFGIIIFIVIIIFLSILLFIILFLIVPLLVIPLLLLFLLGRIDRIGVLSVLLEDAQLLGELFGALVKEGLIVRNILGIHGLALLCSSCVLWSLSDWLSIVLGYLEGFPILEVIAWVHSVRFAIWVRISDDCGDFSVKDIDLVI